MSIRAFVALTLPPETRGALVSACDAFRELAPTWRGEKWVPERNLHVTVRFLGSMPPSEVERVVWALETVCAEERPFELRFDRVVARPESGKARMLWAVASDGVPAAAALAAAVDASLSPLLRLEREERPFSPHVALVRARGARHVPVEALAAANALLSASPEVVSVTGVTLVSSTLGAGAPAYEEIATVPLGRD